MNPDRFTTFAEAYVLAVEEACKNLGAYRLPSQSLKEFALDVALTMLERVQAKGVAAVEHYVINAVGGAFSATCAALGLQNNSRALQDYIDGR